MHVATTAKEGGAGSRLCSQDASKEREQRTGRSRSGGRRRRQSARRSKQDVSLLSNSRQRELAWKGQGRQGVGNPGTVLGLFGKRSPSPVGRCSGREVPCRGSSSHDVQLVGRPAPGGDSNQADRLAPPDILLKAQKHSRQVEKAAGRQSWKSYPPRRENQPWSEEKGGAGRGRGDGRGKGKGKGKKGAWKVWGYTPKDAPKEDAANPGK